AGEKQGAGVGREQRGRERRPPQPRRARFQLAAERRGERSQGIYGHGGRQVGGDDEAVGGDDRRAADPVQALQLLNDVPDMPASCGAVVLERELEACSGHETLLVETTAGGLTGVAGFDAAATPSSCSVADQRRFTSSSPWVGSVVRGSVSETTRSPSVRTKTASPPSSMMARCTTPSPQRCSDAAASRKTRASASDTSRASSVAGCAARRLPSARPTISARPVPGSRRRSTRGAGSAARGAGDDSFARSASSNAAASGNSG